jgi:LCP family protein required for cell wall assembly
MRKPHHQAVKATEPSNDKQFEQLYRTIPSAYGQQPYATHNPETAAPLPASPSVRRWRKICKRVVLFVVFLALLFGLWTGWKLASNTIKVFGWNGLWSLFMPTKLKGEDSGRVNVLLAGNSTDDPNHSGADLTDSIMVASINTTNKTGYIISIPRDLYVDIPGHGYAKINEAYQDGERAGFSENGYADGGMGLLQKTVSEHLGLPVHYYALVNYTALREAVDAVGGVTITIESSDPRGLYDPSRDLSTGQPLVKLPNGEVTLNGSQALNLARARGGAKGSYGFATSDFARTDHQRQILLAIKDKAMSAGTLSNPVRMGELFDSFGSNVKTDLSLGEVRRFYALTKDIPNDKIVSVSLNDANGTNLLQSYRTRSGQSALVPRKGVDDYSEIQAFIGSL